MRTAICGQLGIQHRHVHVHPALVAQDAHRVHGLLGADHVVVRLLDSGERREVDLGDQAADYLDQLNAELTA